MNAMVANIEVVEKESWVNVGRYANPMECLGVLPLAKSQFLNERPTSQHI